MRQGGSGHRGPPRRGVDNESRNETQNIYYVEPPPRLRRGPVEPSGSYLGGRPSGNRLGERAGRTRRSRRHTRTRSPGSERLDPGSISSRLLGSLGPRKAGWGSGVSNWPSAESVRSDLSLLDRCPRRTQGRGGKTSTSLAQVSPRSHQFRSVDPSGEEGRGKTTVSPRRVGVESILVPDPPPPAPYKPFHQRRLSNGTATTSYGSTSPPGCPRDPGGRGVGTPEEEG